MFGGSTSSYVICLLCTNSITDLFSLSYSATLLVTWQIYSPVSFVIAKDTLTLLSTLLSLVVVELIVTRASAISRVPLWYHSMLGAGNPLATQNKVVMSDIATLTSESEEFIMTGGTVWVDITHVYYYNNYYVILISTHLYLNMQYAECYIYSWVDSRNAYSDLGLFI